MLMKAKSVREASLVKVEPGPNQGKAEMCKLEHITVLSLKFKFTKMISGRMILHLKRVLYSKRNDSSMMKNFTCSGKLYSQLTRILNSRISRILMEFNQSHN